MSSELNCVRVYFTAKQKNLLKELVLENYDDIENKGCSYDDHTKKRLAWESVTERYNQQCDGVPRSQMQLINLWRKLKSGLKKEYFKSTSVHKWKCKQFPQIIPQILQEEVSKNDDDNEMEKQSEIVNNEQNVDENNDEEVQLPVVLLSNDVSDVNTADAPRNTGFLQNRKRRKFREEQLNGDRDRNILSRTYLAKEHSLKVKQLIEAHAWAKEEHKLKMSNLRLENLILQKMLNQDI